MRSMYREIDALISTSVQDEWAYEKQSPILRRASITVPDGKVQQGTYLSVCD